MDPHGGDAFGPGPHQVLPSVFPFGDGWRGPLLALAGGLIAAGSLLPGGYSAQLALGAAVLLTLCAAVDRSVWWMAPLLPLVALADGGWMALALATLVAVALPLALHGRRERRRVAALATVRTAVHDAEHEAAILERHLDRYPTLLATCQALAGLRRLDEWARVLVEAVAGRSRGGSDVLRRESRLEALGAGAPLVPGLIAVRVQLATATGPGTIAVRAVTGPLATALDEAATYVLGEGRTLVQRKAGTVLVSLPLGRAGQGRHHGVLGLECAARGREDHLVLETLDCLARLAGQALAALELIEDANALALYDQLTGLYGRDEFLRRLDEQIGVVRRHEDSLGVIMLDLDHLKRVNDDYGHAAGDEALRAVAGAIRAALTDGAVACRYGGEEFAVLVPFTRGGRVKQTADDLLGRVRALRPWPEHARRIGASLGWAVLHEGENALTLLARADAALYRAKREGRDRVVSAEGM